MQKIILLFIPYNIRVASVLQYAATTAQAFEM